MPKCRVCGKDSFWTVDLASKICKDCKKKEKLANKDKTEDNKSNEDSTDEIKKNIISEETDKQNKKTMDNKSKNKSDIPNDYPVMEFLGKWFNFIALINAITGCIIALISLIDGSILGVIGGLLIGLIFWALSKFLSESVKILSDIANNIKVIRINSEYWKK